MDEYVSNISDVLEGRVCVRGYKANLNHCEQYDLEIIADYYLRPERLWCINICNLVTVLLTSNIPLVFKCVFRRPSELTFVIIRKNLYSRISFWKYTIEMNGEKYTQKIYLGNYIVKNFVSEFDLMKIDDAEYRTY